MTRTWCVLNGRMYPISTSSSAITDISNKDISNSAGDQASLTIRFSGGAPGTSSAKTITVSSGGVSFVTRFFSSDNGESYDTTSSADHQIDVNLSTFTQETARDSFSTALATKFQPTWLYSCK